MHDLHGLIFCWEGTIDNQWAAVYLCRVDFNDGNARRYARTQVIINTAGYTRHWEEKFAREPYSYHRFVSSEYTVVEQNEENGSRQRSRYAV